MKSETRTAFDAYLKENFSPKLREVGFKGSGANFRRINGDVINTINIQHSSRGDECAVNLGLHLTFLPAGWEQKLPDLKKITEIDCEFRRRLAPPSKSDFWWPHKTLLRSPTSNAANLCETYFKWGEAAFEAFDSVEKIVAAYLPERLTGDVVLGFGDQTVARVAMTMARIHEHLGDNTRAAEFARIGLRELGRGVALKPELNRLASLAP